MKNDFEKYLTLRNIENISDSWLYQCKHYLMQYLDYVSWRIDEDKTLEYCKHLKERHPVTYYRKKVYQIRRFLEYLKVEWATSIKLPPEPEYYPKRINKNDIEDTLSNFKGHKYFKQLKAVILLGSTSGMRAEEIYQLEPYDIDIENRVVLSIIILLRVKLLKLGVVGCHSSMRKHREASQTTLITSRTIDV